MKHSTKMTLTTSFNLTTYQPNVPASMFDIIPHVETHTIEVICGDGIKRTITLGYLGRVLEASDGYQTPGQILDTLIVNAPHGKE